MVDKKRIFKEGSKTYYNASLFFPRKILDEVTTLYAFVRVIDDYVDNVPQQEKEFYAIKKQVTQAHKGKITGNEIVDDFFTLKRKRNFKKEWIDAFINSMEFDLGDNVCTTKKEFDTYVYGSADVIGLFMAQIMELPKESHKYARSLGACMQRINFIRDVNEDVLMKRWYLPLDTTRTKLKAHDMQYLLHHPQEFSSFLREHIKTYYKEQRKAQKGFKYMPLSVRVPVKTASDMYLWTARQIEKNPMIVFERKVKPKKSKIIATFLKEYIVEGYKELMK